MIMSYMQCNYAFEFLMKAIKSIKKHIKLQIRHTLYKLENQELLYFIKINIPVFVRNSRIEHCHYVPNCWNKLCH